MGNSPPLRLGVNIDHIATVRNARGGAHPCPVRAARLAQEAGADGITAHLREDRRHIRDEDVERLKKEVKLPLNLEMAATEEMLQIALKVRPHAVCIVPEKRAELTTEGGLDVIGQEKNLVPYVKRLRDAGIRVSLFIAPDAAQVEAAARTGADIVELHTGKYAESFSCHPRLARGPRATPEYTEDTPGPRSEAGMTNISENEIRKAATLAHSLKLEVHAGHGLTYENVRPIAAIPEIVELNIGHFLVGEALMSGIRQAVRTMRRHMDAARASGAA